MSITALKGACFDGKEALANFKFFSVQFLGLGFPHKISCLKTLKGIKLTCAGIFLILFHAC